LAQVTRHGYAKMERRTEYPGQRGCTGKHLPASCSRDERRISAKMVT